MSPLRLILTLKQRGHSSTCRRIGRRGLQNIAMRPSIEAVRFCSTNYLHPADLCSQVLCPVWDQWMRGKVSVRGCCICNGRFCADIGIWRWAVLVACIKLSYGSPTWLKERLPVISPLQVLHRSILALEYSHSLGAILNHRRSPHSQFWRHNGRNQQFSSTANQTLTPGSPAIIIWGLSAYSQRH